jgi:hypothetical protein
MYQWHIEEREDLLGWLSKIHYNVHHRHNLQGILVHSGDWLINEPSFIQWRDSSQTSVLWLHGIREYVLCSDEVPGLTFFAAGSGKTKLALVAWDYQVTSRF